MSKKEVKFMALMKELKKKSLVSGDSGGRLMLEFRCEPKNLIGLLDSIMDAESEVEVVIRK